MAEPFDSATTFLTDTASAIRQLYHGSFGQQMNRFGQVSNRILKPSKRRLDGDGITVQVMSKNLYGARLDTDLNADFHTPRTFGSDSYKATISETAGSNDFRRVSISLQTTWLDLRRQHRTNQSAVDYAKKLVMQASENIMETVALHRNLDSTGRIALVNGTPTQNDARTVADASATPAAGTGARFIIDNGSISSLPPGLVISAYTGDTLDNFYEVTDYNPRDKSVGVNLLNSDAKTVDSSGTPDIADDDAIYVEGNKDKALISFGEWFKADADLASGESFLGNDRTTSSKRWMRPHFSGPTANETFSKKHIDTFFVELGHIVPNPEKPYVMVSTPELWQRFMDEHENNLLVTFPTTEQRGKKLADAGFDGQPIYRHPLAGRIALVADQFAPQSKVRLYRLEDWETLHPGDQQFEWMPGYMGNWYRMPSSTPGGGDTTTLRMDGLMALCDICLMPRIQGQIENVTAT
jgi:hypothetical protein